MVELFPNIIIKTVILLDGSAYGFDLFLTPDGDFIHEFFRIT